jgi:DNA-binding NarL/FixJ family response regulator
VLIVDDHPSFRASARAMLEAGDFQVIAEAGDGSTALELLKRLRPDVVLLDVDMPRAHGFSVLRALKDADSRPEFVLMTMHGRQDLLRSAFELGVKAYVVKEGAMLDVVDAIRAVREGRPYISSELSAALLTRAGEGAAGAATAAPFPADWSGRLTRTEVKVLRLIAEFKTSKEIAQELGIHYRTVENHRTAIAAKLGLSGSHALTKFAVEHRDRLV